MLTPSYLIYHHNVYFISYNIVSHRASYERKIRSVYSVLPYPLVHALFRSTLSCRDRTLHTCDRAPIWLHIGNRLGRRSAWANRCRSLRTLRYQSNSCLLSPWRRVFPVEDWIPLIDHRIVLIVTGERQRQPFKNSYFRVRWLYQRKKGEKETAIPCKYIPFSLVPQIFPFCNTEFFWEYTITLIKRSLDQDFSLIWQFAILPFFFFFNILSEFFSLRKHYITLHYVFFLWNDKIVMNQIMYLNI